MAAHQETPMTTKEDTPVRVRWARLRFQIVGSLLAAPAGDGQLKTRIEELAARRWSHPTTGESIRFSFKSIERWFYAARAAAEPIEVLARKVPSHAGSFPSVSAALGKAIAQQHAEHPRWTFKLHYDNLRVRAREAPELGLMPGYASVCRYMKHHGLLRARKPRHRHDNPHDGSKEFSPRETRSYEVSHVHGLWHLDFHEGSRAVITSKGEPKKPHLLGILDDHSRLCCHLQWYLADECTEDLVHGLIQAFQKRGLPRKLLTDNGAAMTSAEVEQGLERLSILHTTTLPYSPEQNGKQENFWGQVEGRLLPMLEGEPHLTLDLLNTATQAWVEGEYHQSEHSEIKQAPIQRFLSAPSVGRPCPSSEMLRRAFKVEVSRKQRRSDGTVTVFGIRFEVPSAYRHLIRLHVRAARWDLSSVDLVDPRSGAHMQTLFPIDKTKNADGFRRPLLAAGQAKEPKPATGMAPLLRALMADYAATGLPPAFIPKDDSYAEDDGAEET
jgi:putative transposase